MNNLTNNENLDRSASVVDSQWPACSILLWGTFGTKAPAERRYLTRVCTVAAGSAVWVAFFVLALHSHPHPLIRALSPLVAVVLITYIAWEFRVYLYSLDELARRMQYEAMSLTYLTGFVATAWLWALGLFARTFLHWSLNEKALLLTPFLYFLLEPVRAGWLYYVSRRY